MKILEVIEELYGQYGLHGNLEVGLFRIDDHFFESILKVGFRKRNVGYVYGEDDSELGNTFIGLNDEDNNFWS